MPWQVPITVDGLEYPVTFNTEEQPTQQDLDEAVQQILSQRGQALQPAQPAGETPGYLSQLGSALGLGYRQMKSGVGATFNALTGDTEDVAAEMAEQAKLQREQQAAQTPQDIEFMRRLDEAEKAYELARGPVETISALSQYPAAAFAEPGAAFKTAVQSAPNVLISGATSLAGYGLGGLVGGAAGIETGPGAILTGIAGAAAGGALSNTLMEAGPSIFDALNEKTNGAASNMTAEQISAFLKANPDVIEQGLKTGAIRGSVIGAVEALGVKGSGRLLTMPERAAARAAQKTLVDAGVDVTSKKAVDAALLDPTIRSATKTAAEAAKNQFSSAGNLARMAGASAIETGAAGAGELAAQAAAGQDISTKEAFMEMLGEAALSAPMAAATKAVEGAKYALTPSQEAEQPEATQAEPTVVPTAEEPPSMLPFTREDIRATELPFSRQNIRGLSMIQPEIAIAQNAIAVTQNAPFTDVSGQAVAATIAENIQIASQLAVPTKQAAEEVGSEVTPSPAMEMPSPPQGVDMASASVSPIITGAPIQPVETQEDATRKIPLEESVRQEPQDRAESREAEETGAGDQLLSPAEGEEEVATFDLNPLTKPKSPPRKGFYGEVKGASGQTLGSLWKDKDGNFRVYQLEDFSNRIIAESPPIPKERIKKSGGVQVSAGQNVQFYRILPPSDLVDGDRQSESQNQPPQKPVTEPETAGQSSAQAVKAGVSEEETQTQKIHDQGARIGNTRIGREPSKENRTLIQGDGRAPTSKKMGVSSEGSSSASSVSNAPVVSFREYSDAPAESPRGLSERRRTVTESKIESAKKTASSFESDVYIVMDRETPTRASGEPRVSRIKDGFVMAIVSPDGSVFLQDGAFRPNPQTKQAAEKQTPVPLRGGTGAAGVVQSEPVEGSIPTVGKVSTETETTSSEKLDASEAQVVTDEKVDLTPELDRAISSSLTEEEKAFAAKELGVSDWGEEAITRFKQILADWSVNARKVSERLANLFQKVLDASRAVLLAIGVFVGSSVNTQRGMVSTQSVKEDIPVTQIAEDLAKVERQVAASIASTPEAEAALRMSPPKAKDLIGFVDSMPSVGPVAITIPTRETGGKIDLVAEKRTPAKRADFRGIVASEDATMTADWIVLTNDNKGKPFIVGDKTNGSLFIFDKDGNLIQKTSALFGLNVGDQLPVDPWTERVTPSGRFFAKTRPSEEYGSSLRFYEPSGSDGAVAIHRVYLDEPAEKRQLRLDSKSPADNRISYGCVNVDGKIYDKKIAPTFAKGGFVYIMPETPSGRSAFKPFSLQKQSTEDKKAAAKFGRIVSEAEQKQAKEEESAAKEREKAQKAAKASLNSVVGPQKKDPVVGTVTKADVETAREALTNSGEIPNAYLTNVYESREAFLADKANARLFPSAYARLQTEKNIEGLYENGQTLIFAKQIQVSDLDRGLAKMLGVSDEQAAARRVIAHENGHKAISLFTMAEKRELRGYLMRAYSDEQIAKLVERYTEYADWRTNPESRLEALEELLMRDFERMEKIPTGGVWDDIVQFLKRVWRRLTGQKGEPKLKELKDVVRLMRNAMKRPAVPLGSYTLKDGGQVKLSMIAPTARITPEQDAEYLEAVAAGDMEKAQRMVDEAAKAAGYNMGPVWHGSPNKDFTTFDRSKIGTTTVLPYDAPKGFYFAKDEKLTARYGPNKIRAFVRGPFMLNNTKIVVVESPNQIKSADPVTRDDAGNVIPLSQRFQTTSPDIRFSRPQFASETSAAFTAGSEAARSSIYSERDMDIREAIRRAYDAMPKQNSVAVPIGELFAKTEELMPGVTQEEFSNVLQDLFEDNGAVLQEGDVVGPIKIKISPSEMDFAQWVTEGPMGDTYPMEEVLERSVDESELPYIKNGELVLPVEDIARDALYRVSVQIEDMIDDYRDNGATSSQVATARRAARSLADKIRLALPDIRGQINVTTPEGKRAGFVVVMPRAAKASRIPIEDAEEASKSFKVDLAEAGKGRVDKKAKFKGIPLKDTEIPEHNVKSYVLYRDPAIKLIDDLMAKTNDILVVAEALQDPEFQIAIGLQVSKDVSSDMITIARNQIGIEIENRLANEIRKERNPRRKRELELAEKRGIIYYNAGTGAGQALQNRQESLTDPRYRGRNLFNQAKLQKEQKAKDKLDAITGGTEKITDIITGAEQKAAEETTQAEVEAQESAAEDDEYAKLVSEGEAELTNEEKGLWERAKMLLRRFAMYAKRKGARAANAAKASLSAEQRKELDELNAIMQMSDEEAAKAESKDRAEFAAVLKKLLGEEKPNDTPQQKKTRQKRVKMIDVVRRYVESGKPIDLSDQQTALKGMLREMNKARPADSAPLERAMPWRKILSSKPKDVAEYRQRILEAVSSIESFQNLTEEQKERLADLYAEAWEERRQAILDRMLRDEIKKARDRDEISDDVEKKLQQSRNKILEIINLGGFNNNDLVKILGERYGISTSFTEEQKARIQKLADQLQDEDMNTAKRNKLAMEFAVELAGAMDVPVTEIIANWWTSSVLFGPQTIFSIGAAFLNGGYSITTIGTRRMLAKLFKGDVQGSLEESILMLKGIARYLGAFKQAGRRAWNYLWSGDVGLLGIGSNDILSEISNFEQLQRFQRHKLLAEQLAKDPRMVRRYVGVYLRFVSRLLTALDAFNVMVTKAGTASLALRMSGMSTENIIKAEKMLNLKAYKDQVIRDYFDNKAPRTPYEKGLVDSYAEAEMYRAIDKMGGKMENADYLASESAMTMHPTGFGGVIYDAIRGFFAQRQSNADEYLEKMKKDWVTRKDLTSVTFLALAYLRQFAAYNAAGLTGSKFVRYASNKFNQGLSFIPFAGLLRQLESKDDRIKGKDAFIETIYRNQVIGALMLFIGGAVLGAIEDEPDDEKRGNFWNGGWANLTPDQKKQLLAKGQKEYTMGFKYNGRWYVFNYQNWPLNQVLSAIGSMSDQIRFSPKQWNEKNLLSKTVAGMVSGVKSTLEIPALSGLQELVDNRLASKDPTERSLDRISRVASGWVGGFVPRILKDIDFATQPELRKYETLWEKTASHIPIYRRYVGEEYYDILGKPIKRNVIPGSREFMMGPTEPEYKILGALNSRNIWLTPANAEYRMVGKGRNRRRLTQEEADAYSLETGKGYRQMLLRYGQRALQMPTERARAFLSDKADEVRDRALKKVYRGYTK